MTDQQVPEQLRVRVLGDFEIEGISEHRVGSRKARAVLKALALARGQSVRADALMELVWGEQPPQRAHKELSVLVSRLRATLGRTRLPRKQGGYALAVDWLDVDAMGQLADESHRRLRDGAYVEALASSLSALTLYRGPLLAEEPPAPWLVEERVAAEHLAATVRETASRAALATGDLDLASAMARLTLNHDPYNETSLALLMTALVRSGRPASALAEYAGFRERLSQDLGVNPSAAADDLNTAILRSTALPDDRPD
ncbi:MAG: winged helix-turn-helix domain-containing protein [Candidatus Dormibacteraeota bacterium]|nr:winged helix-turn-helix domain-containing protein [Candidatus Dormibacteraeota bacterium]